MPHTLFYSLFKEAAEAHSGELQQILSTVSLLTPSTFQYQKKHVQLDLTLIRVMDIPKTAPNNSSGIEP